MRRLEPNQMLDQRIARGDRHYSEFEALAYRLAKLFACSEKLPLKSSAYIARLRAELRQALAAHQPHQEQRVLHTVRNLEAFIARGQPVLGEMSITDRSRAHPDAR